MGVLEESLKINTELRDLVKELVFKIDQLQIPDTSWVNVPYILSDLQISNKDFHEFWKKKMTFLRRAKGKGSNYRAIRHEYEAWKQDYWNSLLNSK